MGKIQPTQVSHQLLFLAALGVQQPPPLLGGVGPVQQVLRKAIGFGRKDWQRVVALR